MGWAQEEGSAPLLTWRHLHSISGDVHLFICFGHRPSILCVDISRPKEVDRWQRPSLSSAGQTRNFLSYDLMPIP